MLRYTPPTVTRIGSVAELTGQLRNGVPDLFAHGNIL